jgi:DNA-binding protein H-NS
MPKIISANELKAQIAKLQARLERASGARNKAIREVMKQLQAHDITLAELKAALDGRAGKGSARKPRKTAKRASRLKGKKAPVKYRDAKGNTWAGRGNPPRWLVAAEKEGKKRQSFAV